MGPGRTVGGVDLKVRLEPMIGISFQEVDSEGDLGVLRRVRVRLNAENIVTFLNEGSGIGL